MKRLEWIEAMRGIAACWVVLCHAAPAVQAFIGGPRINFFLNGYVGVDFFFVLSGFIIAKSSAEMKRRGQGLREYASARAIRIYVPYLPVGIGIYLLYALFPGVSRGSQEGVSLFTSLTLLPGGRPALSVAWTLVSEVIFYVIFSLFFVSRRALLAVLGAWAAVTAWAWSLNWWPGYALSYFVQPLNLWFLVGVGVAWLTRRGVSDRTALACLVIGLLVVGSQAFLHEPNRAIMGPGFAFLVAASCAPWPSRTSPGRVLLLLGAASYSIYLVHNVTLSAVVRLLQHQHHYVALVGIVAAALAAGLVYHLLYERHALRWMRARLKPAATIPGTARA